LISTPTTAQNSRKLYFSLRDHRDFVTAYNKYAFHKFLTITHIVEEDRKTGKRHKNKWLGNHLKIVQFLWGNFIKNILTINRDVDLTYQQIQQYITMNSCFNFTSFNSTSTNRILAKIYGNSLFIIYLNLINVYGEDNIWVGAYVASISNFLKGKESLT
jgi:hypothetical protein